MWTVGWVGVVQFGVATPAVVDQVDQDLISGRGDLISAVMGAVGQR